MSRVEPEVEALIGRIRKMRLPAKGLAGTHDAFRVDGFNLAVKGVERVVRCWARDRKKLAAQAARERQRVKGVQD